MPHHLAVKSKNSHSKTTDPVSQLTTTIRNATQALKRYGGLQLARDVLSGEIEEIDIEGRYMDEPKCLILPFRSSTGHQS